MIKCKDCKYVRNCETLPDTNADECEVFDNWYDEMEKAEQEYDAMEYELELSYNKGYKEGRADAIDECINDLIREHENWINLGKRECAFAVRLCTDVLFKLKDRNSV